MGRGLGQDNEKRKKMRKEKDDDGGFENNWLCLKKKNYSVLVDVSIVYLINP